MKNIQNNILNINSLGGYDTPEQLQWHLKNLVQKKVSLSDPDNPNEIPYTQIPNLSNDSLQELNEITQQQQYFYNTIDPTDEKVYTYNQWMANQNKATLPVVSLGLHSSIIPPSSLSHPVPLHPSPYYFYGSMPEAVLHNYLDRFIDMYGLFMWCQFYDTNLDALHYNPIVHNCKDSFGNILPPVGPGPSYFNINGDLTSYNPLHYTYDQIISNGFFTNTNYQLAQDLQMLLNLKPKMIGDTISFWADIGETGWAALDWVCKSAEYQIRYLHSFDPEIIFAAVIDEVCDISMNNITIPDWILREFNLIPPPTSTSGTTDFHGADASYTRKFDYNNMVYLPPYPTDASFPNDILSSSKHMDITRIETQMWFLYLASRYIDCGHEAIGFGDTYTMLYNDGPQYDSLGNKISNGNGYSGTWSVIQKVRAYGATRNRGVVLCLASIYNKDGINIYYDPDPAHPLPDFQRQILFDVFRNKLPLSRRNNTMPACADGSNDPSVLGTGTGFPYIPSNYPVHINATHFKDNNPLLYDKFTQLLYDNKGGLHPQGWFCNQVPFFLDFDNGSCAPDSGCHYSPTDWYNFNDYGYDIITWFALQNTENRNKVLKYLWYRIKCINVYGHLLMEGRKLLTLQYSDNSHPYPDNLKINFYRANAGTFTDLSGVFDQEQTIKDIWNGVFNIATTWVSINFSQGNVSNITRNIDNWIPDLPPANSLIFVGSDKIFFIGSDGYIHGYIKVNGEFNGGTWLTVSPSYSAEAYYSQIVAAQQVPAIGSLVTNPAGTMLLYIGIDNKIHGFNIISVWEYKYFDILLTEPPVTSISNLIFLNNNTFYFIGNYLWGYPSYPGADYGFYPHYQIVLGCQKSTADSWQTIIPAFISGTISGSPHPLDQLQAASNGLVIAPSGTKLYYVSIDGYLCYYTISSISDYQYFVATDVNTLLDTNNIIIVSGINLDYNKLYFAGKNTTNGSIRIYCITNIDFSPQLLNLAVITQAVQHLSVTNQAQVLSNTNIALSPSGSMIAYFGILDTGALVLAYYKKLSDTVYTYYTFNTGNFVLTGTENSLQFTDNNNLFFISKSDGTVQQIKYEEDYCKEAENIMYSLWPKYPDH